MSLCFFSSKGGLEKVWGSKHPQAQLDVNTWSLMLLSLILFFVEVFVGLSTFSSSFLVFFPKKPQGWVPSNFLLPLNKKLGLYNQKKVQFHGYKNSETTGFLLRRGTWVEFDFGINFILSKKSPPPVTAD